MVRRGGYVHVRPDFTRAPAPTRWRGWDGCGLPAALLRQAGVSLRTVPTEAAELSSAELHAHQTEWGIRWWFHHRKFR